MKLSSKVILAFIFYGLLTSVSIGMFLYFSLRQQTITTFYQKQSTLASQTLLTIDRLLYERYLDINEIASGDFGNEFLKEEPDLLTIEEKLLDLNKYSGPWDLVNIIDDQKNIIVSTDNDLIGNSLNDDNHSIEAYQVALNGETYYSDAFVSSDTGRATVVFAAPLEKELWIESPTIVVIAQFTLPSALELLDVQDLESYLFNENGLLIKASSPSLNHELFNFNIMNGEEKDFNHSIESHQAQGLFSENKVFHTFISEPGYLNYNWTLIFEVDESLVLGEVNSLVLKSILIMVPILLVAIILIMLFTMKTVINPITQLSMYMYTVKFNDISLKNLDMFSRKGNDEIGLLWKNFGEMISRLKSSTDEVTHQAEIAKREHTRLMASITALPIGFILLDETGKVKQSNKSAKRILNIKKKIVNIEQIQKVLNNVTDLQKTCKKCVTNRKQILIKEVEFGDGQYLSLFIVPVIFNKDEEETIDIVVLFEDITEEKLLSRTRDEFFAVAAHELRTPLTIIRGNSSLIQEYFNEKIDDKSMKVILSDINDSSTLLINIVEDFLNVSLLEQKQVEFKSDKFEIEPVINEVIEELTKKAKNKKLYIKLKTDKNNDLLVKADRERVKHIVLNLLKNGIKFTEKGGVTISTSKKDNKLIIEFSDTGVGIPKENQKMLFRKFTQTGNDPLERDATQGTGLGLYISRLSAQGMNAEVNFKKSKTGVGSTFEVILPLANK